MDLENIKLLLEDISVYIVEIKEEPALLKMLVTLDEMVFELDKHLELGNDEHETMVQEIENLREYINEELGYLYVDDTESFDDDEEEEYYED